jgi:signal transduction histidine kinase
MGYGRAIDGERVMLYNEQYQRDASFLSPPPGKNSAPLLKSMIMNTQALPLSQADPHFAYLITDHNLVVREAGAAVALVHPNGVVVGQSLLQLIPAIADAKPRFDEMLAGGLAHYEVEFTTEQPEGPQLRWQLTAIPLRNATDDITCLALRIEPAVAPSELHQEIQRLDAHIQVFKTMMEIIAHDLSTPVTLLSGYLELLQNHGNFAPTSEGGEYIQIMTKTSGRLLALINSLADLAQAEAGLLKLNLQYVDVVQLIYELTREFRPSLMIKKQEVVIEALTQLPLLLCDIARFSQIITNLLSNASKYSPDFSTITVKVGLTAHADFIQISVYDSGVGIAYVDLENIFKRHFRTTEAQTSAIRGLGMGLYIARLMIELHGGSIWCESAPSVGSTFHFTLPIPANDQQTAVLSDDVYTHIRWSDVGPESSLQRPHGPKPVPRQPKR